MATSASFMSRADKRLVQSVPLVDRNAIFFITLVAPTLLALHLLYDLIWLIYIVKITFGLLILLRLGTWGRVLLKDGISSPFLWAAIFFLADILVTISGLVVSSDTVAISKVRGLLSATVWCSGLWLAVIYVQTSTAFKLAMRMLTWLGILISGSALMSYLANKEGIKIGEILVSNEGNMRVFGPLGDNAPFVILFFFFLAFSQARWWSVLFHASAILISAGRGVAIAAAVGILLHICLPFLQKGDLGFSKRLGKLFRDGGMIAAIAIFGLSLTTAGKLLISRFSDASESIQVDRLGGRLSNMEFAWELIKDRPLFGYGYSGYAEQVYRTYGVAMSDTTGPSEGARGMTINATNQLAQVAVDGGVVTAILFLIFIYYLCSKILRSIREPDLPEREYACAFGVYLTSIFIGMQSAVYIIDQSGLGYFVFWIAGLFEAHRQIYLAGPQSRIGPRRKLPTSARTLTGTFPHIAQ